MLSHSHDAAQTRDTEALLLLIRPHSYYVCVQLLKVVKDLSLVCRGHRNSCCRWQWRRCGAKRPQSTRCGCSDAAGTPR